MARYQNKEERDVVLVEIELYRLFIGNVFDSEVQV